MSKIDKVSFKNIDLSENIMKEIRSGKVKMRPRIYFIIKSLGLKIGLIILLILAIYLISVSLFKLRIYDPLGFLWLGMTGFRGFIGAIPWKIISLAIISITATIAFLSKFDLAYQRNFSAITLGLLFLTLAGGMFLDNTGINDKAKKAGKYPAIYQGNYLSDYWVTGEIEKADIYKKELIIETPHKETIKVVWDKSTTLPTGSNFKHGQYIQVAGSKKGNIFVAKGIIIRNNNYRY